MADDIKTPTITSNDEVLKALRGETAGGEDAATSGQVTMGDRARLLAGTATRVVLPMVGQAAGALIPLPGTAEAGGAAGGGLGEYLAEKYIDPEVMNPGHKVNLGRVGMASATGAVPLSWLGKGKAIAQAIKGAALGYGGTAGNKYFGEGESAEKSLDPTNWSVGDWISGPIMGGTIGYGGGKIQEYLGGNKTPQQPAPAPTKFTPSPTPPVVTEGPMGNKRFQVPRTPPKGATPEQAKVFFEKTKINPEQFTPKYQAAQDEKASPIEISIGKESGEKAGEKAFNSVAKPVIKKNAASQVKSVSDQIHNTTPSFFKSTQPRGESDLNVGQVVETPGSAVADPEPARPDEVPIPGEVTTALPGDQELTPATQAALSTPANKRMMATQLSQERAGTKSALTKEAAADLQSTKGEIKADTDLEKAQGQAIEANKKFDSKQQQTAQKFFDKTKKDLQAQFTRASNRRDAEIEAGKALEAQGEIQDAKAGMDKSVMVRRVVKGPNGESKVETWRPAQDDDVTGGGGDSGSDPDADPYPEKPDGPFRVMDKANRWIDNNGGRKIWNAPFKDENGDIHVTRISDYPGDIVGDRLNEGGSEGPTGMPEQSQNPEDVLVNPNGKAKNAAQAMRRARPFGQLSKEEQQALVPYLQDAADKGYKGNMDDAADELAHLYGMHKEGLESAKSVGADNDSLVSFVRKKGGLNLDKEKGGGYTGELKQLRDHFKGNLGNRSGKGLVNNKTGVSVDRMLELLKEDPNMFPQIKKGDANSLFAALREASGTKAGTPVLDTFDTPGNWWHKLQPEGHPIPGQVPDVEIGDYTGGDNPERVEVPIPAAKAGESEPNLPGVEGPIGGKARPLAEPPPLTLTGGEAPPTSKQGVLPMAPAKAEVPSDIPPELADAIDAHSKASAAEGHPEAPQLPKGARGSQKGRAKSLKKGGGGTTLSAFGAGQGGALLEAIRNNPMFAARVLGGAAGAGIGAYTDNDDPLTGAIVGGAAGALLPSAAKALPNVDWSKMAKRLPDIQRFNYLTDPNGLIANTVGAPTGLGATTAIEKMLQGDPRGLRLLKELPSLPRRWKASLQEAGSALGKDKSGVMNVAEQDMPYARAETRFDRGIALPAQSITSAHMALRDAAMAAGFSEPEAVEMALGNEPIRGTGNATLRAFGQGWQSMKSPQGFDVTIGDKTFKVKVPNTLGNMVAPFTRTASNVLAATPTRVPLLGLLAKAAKQNISWPELLAQQTTGTGVSALAYTMGSVAPPEWARYIRKWVRNLGGRYGLIATAAFEAGQAAQLGGNSGDAIVKGAKEGFPMPTGEVISDWGNSIMDLLHGEPKIPRSAIPVPFQQRSDGSGGPIPYDWLSTPSQ